MITIGFVLSCLFTGSLAGNNAGNPLFHQLVVHESIQSIPGGFIKNDAAPASQMLTLRLALTQNNIQSLESELYAVSDPTSTRYGQHLSKEEVCQVTEIL